MKYSILETDVKHVKDILSGKVALPFPGANSLVEAVKYIREEYKVGLSKSRIIVEQIAALPIAGHLHDHVDGAGREIVLPPDLKKDVLTLIASNEVVSAILAIRRTIPAIGLKEAKDLVDSMRHAMTDAERRKYKVGPSQCLKINLHYRLANQPQPPRQTLPPDSHPGAGYP